MVAPDQLLKLVIIFLWFFQQKSPVQIGDNIILKHCWNKFESSTKDSRGEVGGEAEFDVTWWLGDHARRLLPHVFHHPDATLQSQIHFLRLTLFNSRNQPLENIYLSKPCVPADQIWWNRAFEGAKVSS